MIFIAFNLVFIWYHISWPIKQQQQVENMFKKQRHLTENWLHLALAESWMTTVTWSKGDHSQF